MAQSALVSGQIVYVNPDSECGFITTDEIDQDVLFLRNSIEGAIPDVGEEVRFELIKTQGGRVHEISGCS